MESPVVVVYVAGVRVGLSGQTWPIKSTMLEIYGI